MTRKRKRALKPAFCAATCLHKARDPAMRKQLRKHLAAIDAAGIYVPNSPEQDAALERMDHYARREMLWAAEGLHCAEYDWDVKVPTEAAPDNVCARCADSWIQGLHMARAERVHQRRAISCPCMDASGASIAFVVRGALDGDESAWLQIDGVPHADWNELYRELVHENGGRFVGYALTARECQDAQLRATGEALRQIRMRQMGAVALGVAAEILQPTRVTL